MIYTAQTLTSNHIDRFKELLGSRFVVTDGELLNVYAHDETADFYFLPDVVLKPRTVSEISEILEICNRDRIPVTPRGAGTGLSGGALPHLGGVVLSTERMNSILSIDEQNLQVTTEPGVITQVLQDAVKEKGLFYPPDPHSRGSCFIGGNIAENSGGPKAVKYGVVKDYVLNLQIVLPSGEIIWTGANVLKNATGYNLTQLIVGSEGTLAIVTKIILKLIPLPKHELLILVPFDSAAKACASVAAIFRAGYMPSAIEFMEREAILCTSAFVYGPEIKIPDEVEAHLLIEVDGNNADMLMKDLESISAIVSEYDCGQILFAEDEKQKETLWKLRRTVGEAVRNLSVYKEQDTVVPRAALPLLLTGVKEIGKKYGIKTVCCGHAGDGNLHVNILKCDLTHEQWEGTVKKAIRELFQLVKSLHGTISAEHGIGLLQKEYLDIVFDPVQLRLMKQLKQVFDPHAILNAGKIFDI
jgi:glycolate oxidase